MLNQLLKSTSVRWICLTILISIGVVSCPDTALADDRYIGELPKDGQFRFYLEQIPNNVTLYWDYDFNGHPDTVFACPLAGQGKISSCDMPLKAGDNNYIFTTCPSHYPMYYLTTRECWECLSCRAWFKPPDDSINFPLPAKGMVVRYCNENR